MLRMLKGSWSPNPTVWFHHPQYRFPTANNPSQPLYWRVSLTENSMLSSSLFVEWVTGVMGGWGGVSGARIDAQLTRTIQLTGSPNREQCPRFGELRVCLSHNPATGSLPGHRVSCHLSQSGDVLKLVAALSADQRLASSPDVCRAAGNAGHPCGFTLGTPSEAPRTNADADPHERREAAG
jgi:hypothetical protein